MGCEEVAFVQFFVRSFLRSRDFGKTSITFNSDAFRWYSLQCHAGVDSSVTSSSTGPMTGRRSVLSASFTFPCERMHAREILDQRPKDQKAQRVIIIIIIIITC